jgi:hypothetical protein
MELSLLSLASPTPSTEGWRTPCARRPTTSSSAEVFQVLCTHSHSNSGLPLLRLATETSIRPALYLHGSNNPIKPWVDENKSLTVEPPQRTLCGGIQLHSMQDSFGSDRETIEAHSRLSHGFRIYHAITYTTYKTKA